MNINITVKLAMLDVANKQVSSARVDCHTDLKDKVFG